MNGLEEEKRQQGQEQRLSDADFRAEAEWFFRQLAPVPDPSSKVSISDETVLRDNWRYNTTTFIGKDRKELSILGRSLKESLSTVKLLSVSIDPGFAHIRYFEQNLRGRESHVNTLAALAKARSLFFASRKSSEGTLVATKPVARTRIL